MHGAAARLSPKILISLPPRSPETRMKRGFCSIPARSCQAHARTHTHTHTHTFRANRRKLSTMVTAPNCHKLLTVFHQSLIFFALIYDSAAPASAPLSPRWNRTSAPGGRAAGPRGAAPLYLTLRGYSWLHCLEPYLLHIYLQNPPPISVPWSRDRVELVRCFCANFSTVVNLYKY